MIGINDLPPPPPGRTGWPWTIASDPVVGDWPRLSIITPSLNQARTLEETIRSVLLQGYPNLEYIIIDGGSTDGSLEILRQYAPFLTRWVSEPDRGQADAINKGFARATGEIVAWINSDDRYLPNAFVQVAHAFQRVPDAGLVFGRLELVLEGMTRTIGYTAPPARMLDELVLPYQPTCFFRRSVLERIGFLDVSLNYVMDADLLIRLMTNTAFVSLPNVFASFRIQGPSKTNRAEVEFARELLILLERVLMNRSRYPAWRTFSEGKLRSLFYRRASKHLYMGNHLGESLVYIARAVCAHPPSLAAIARDEGIGWLVRCVMPARWYRSFSAFVRSRN